MARLGDVARITNAAALFGGNPKKLGGNPKKLKFLKPGTPNPPDEPGNGEKIAFWVWSWLDSNGVERHHLDGQPGQKYYGGVHDAVGALYPGLSARRAWRVTGVVEKVLVDGGNLKVLNGGKKGIPPLWWVSHEPPELEQRKTHPRVTERTPIEQKGKPTVTTTIQAPAPTVVDVEGIERPDLPNEDYQWAVRAVVAAMRLNAVHGRFHGTMAAVIKALWPELGKEDNRLAFNAAYVSITGWIKKRHPEVQNIREKNMWLVPKVPGADVQPVIQPPSQPVAQKVSEPVTPPPVDYDEAYGLIRIWLADQPMKRVVRDGVPGDELQVRLKRAVYDIWPEKDGYRPETQKAIYQQVITRIKRNDGAECVKTGSHDNPSTWRFPKDTFAKDTAPVPEVEDELAEAVPELPTAEAADGAEPGVSAESGSGGTADVEAPAAQEVELEPLESAEGVRILWEYIHEQAYMPEQGEKKPIEHEGESGCEWIGSLIKTSHNLFDERYGVAAAEKVAKRASTIYRKNRAAILVHQANPNENRRVNVWLVKNEWPTRTAPEPAADTPTEPEQAPPEAEEPQVQPGPPAEDEPPQEPAQGEAPAEGQRRPDDQPTESAVARQLGGLLGTNSDMDWLSSAMTSVLAHDAQVGNGRLQATEAALQGAKIDAVNRDLAEVNRDLARARKAIGLLMQAALAGLGIGEPDD